MYHDFIMDEIERLAKFIAKAVFNIEASNDEIINIEHFSISEGSLLKLSMNKLLSENKINEAENLLFHELEQICTIEKLEIGFWFYNKVNAMSDEKLNEANFTRQEILEGLQEIKNMAEDEGFHI